MHILYFVVLPKEAAATPKEAMKEAEQFLGDNHFASSEGGLWDCGKCDWYEIGGRWSGLFTMLVLPKEKRKAYEKELSRIDKEYDKRWGKAREQSKTVKGKKEALYQLVDGWREREILQAWQKHFPDSKVICPQARRGTLAFIGHRCDTDDAVLMTKEVWRKFRQEWAKDWESLECVFTDECMEDSLSTVKEKDALGKWWVVVDYHI